MIGNSNMPQHKESAKQPISKVPAERTRKLQDECRAPGDHNPDNPVACSKIALA